jgi:hypothetical protein
MSDGISGIKIIKPTYPVKPVQPSNKDRESGKRKKDAPPAKNIETGEPTDKPTIDEYI